MKRAYVYLSVAGLCIMAACAARRQVTQFEIDQTVMRADSLVAYDKLDSAARIINELARNVSDDTMLLWRQATLNHQLESVEGRRKAARALRKLIESNPDNPRYHLELARVLIEQTREGLAKNELNRVIALTPADETPYLILSELYLKPFFAKGQEDRGDSAELALKRLVAANPTSIAGLVKLSGTEAVRGKTDSAEFHLNLALKVDSTATVANLVTGYVQYLRKDYPASEKHFLRALARMDSLESEGYRSIEYLLPPSSIRAYRKLDARARDSLEQKYWNLADLDPTTAVNERRAEHFARVWEANFAYSDARAERIGWRTDMGETLIRLGRPDEKKRARVGGSLVEAVPIWYWQYRSVVYPCTLAFVDQMQSGNYTFPFPNRDNTGSFRTNASKEVAYLNYMKKPEESTIARERQPLRIHPDIYQFKGPDTLTSSLVFLNIASEGLDFDSIPGPPAAAVEIGEALETEDHAPIWRRHWEDTFSRTEGSENLTARSHFDALPGSYLHSMTAEQRKGERFGLVKSALAIQDFRGDSLVLSDLLLTIDTIPDPVPGVLWQQEEGKRIKPGRVFSVSQPVNLYYEIHNLPKDVSGQTRAEVVYTLQLVKRSESGIKSLVSKVRRPKKESVSFTYRETGRSENVARAIALDLSELREGIYLLTARITDQVFARSASKSIELTLKP